MIDYLTNKPFYIQVFGEQKLPPQDLINKRMQTSTKEYFERDKEASANNNVKLSNRQADPEAQKLREEVNLLRMKEQRLEYCVVIKIN